MQSLCTLRHRCRQRSRNTRYQAGAAPYLDRSSTGWIAPACLAHSFDHLVGECEQLVGDGQSERLGGFEVDYQLELGWLLDRKIIRLLAAQDTIDVRGCLPIRSAKSFP